MGDTKEKVKDNERRKILILGSTGVGKSALCYNLSFKAAKSSSQPVGVTLDFTLLSSEDHKDYIFIDACGFNEGSDGKIAKEVAIKKFFDFCQSNTDGFNLVLLVKNPRNDDYLRKNYNLVKSLIPNIPCGIVVQRSDNGWHREECSCDPRRNHLYSFHLPEFINGVVCVDLPGDDVLNSTRFKAESTPVRFARLEKDIKVAWDFIEEHSNQRFIITKSGFVEGFKYYFNEFCKTLFGIIVFTTEIMKKFIQALKDNGLDEAEAKRIIQGVK